MFEFECAYIVGAWIPVQIASGEEVDMPEQKNGGAVRVLVLGSLYTESCDMTGIQISAMGAILCLNCV